MKIEINKILPNGSQLSEYIAPLKLDLETEIIKFEGPIRVEALVSRITNTVTVDLDISAVMLVFCSRCLESTRVDFKKDLRLSYPVDPGQLVLDLDPDIREELILDYPLQPLCKINCKGLCFKCGGNLNDGKCSCG